MNIESEQLMKILLAVTGAIGTVFLGLIGVGIQHLIKAVISSTVQIGILNEKIEGIVKDTEDIPKLKGDLTALHQKIRELKGGQE